LNIQSAMTTVTKAVTVAKGIFAPGHLGERTQYLPVELAGDVLEQTRTVQRRLRGLPSRAGVYFVLALGMFPHLGYARVWGKLTAGLGGLDLPRPSEKALRDLRRRLGPAPLKALFEVVAGPLAQPRTPGVCFAGLRTVASGGLNSLKVPRVGMPCASDSTHSTSGAIVARAAAMSPRSNASYAVRTTATGSSVMGHILIQPSPRYGVLRWNASFLGARAPRRHWPCAWRGTAP